MSVVELVRRNLASYVSVKIALAIVGLAISIPLFSLWYWAFDSAYLAAFGVGPEIFSRPVFSSRLMLTWFVLGAINPGIWMIGAVALALFGVLFGIHYKARKAKLNASQSNPDESELPVKRPLRMIDVIDRSVTPSMCLFLTPLLIFFLLLMGMVFMAEKAEALASNQIEAYVNDNICPDTFNDHIHGCYAISGEPDSNYFIIANNENLLIYLNRVEQNDDVLISVTIKNKLSNKKIIRELKGGKKGDSES